MCDSENEGDLVCSAESISTETMNFMIREGSGIVCLAITSEQVKKLNLSPMVPPNENTSFVSTPFTVSIDAKGVSGVSASDRVQTIQLAINPNVQPDDLAKPGHIFPLHARDGGVLERQGHTEGSVDLLRLAGLRPAAVICEIMNKDGTMARGEQLEAFAVKHNINILSINDIIAYRLKRENLIADEISTILPLEDYGSYTMTVIKEKYSKDEHIVLKKESTNPLQPILVRIHSSCVTGDIFASQRCDCHRELHYSLNKMSDEGGILIYLKQEGRGIGLFNKIKAYALQEQGLDTVEANEKLGLPVDARQYHISANIFRHTQIKQIRLLTNNPDKINELKKYGIANVIHEPMPVFHNEHNLHYLITKKEKLNHSINLDVID